MKNFHDLIQELGELLDQELTVDINQACTLQIGQNLKVQMELDSPGEVILLMSFLSELPPGRFRENILKDALKTNFLAEQKEGTLAYIEKENVLVLHHSLYSSSLTAQTLLDQLILFIDRAKKWQDAIEGGRTSPEGELPEGTQKKSSIFGIK